MHKGAIFAGLVTAAMLVGTSAQSAEDRNRPKCDFHIFADMNDHWALTEGTPKRKWLVMNVSDASVIVSGSEITTPGHPEHEELIATGESTIATMKYGQPEIHLAPAGENTMASGTMASGDNVTDAGATTAGAGTSTSADATSTTSANNTMTNDTATAGGSSTVGATTTASASNSAAGAPAPTTKTTVVICRFFERKR